MRKLILARDFLVVSSSREMIPWSVRDGWELADMEARA